MQPLRQGDLRRASALACRLGALDALASAPKRPHRLLLVGLSQPDQRLGGRRRRHDPL
jgi:hypothetical protein